jgi:hypothetical protein
MKQSNDLNNSNFPIKNMTQQIIEIKKNTSNFDKKLFFWQSFIKKIRLFVGSCSLLENLNCLNRLIVSFVDVIYI